MLWCTPLTVPVHHRMIVIPRPLRLSFYSLLIIAGVVILFNAFSFTATLTIIIGIVMILYGIYYLILAFSRY